VATIAIVAGAVLWAISTVGTPETTRGRKLDQARVEDLKRIDWAVARYYSENSELPGRLEKLHLEEQVLNDPVTGEKYGYRVVDSRHYQLSATFTSEGSGDRYDSMARDWSHPAGVHWFSLAVPEN
jgi:hypothetical protein